MPRSLFATVGRETVSVPSLIIKVIILLFQQNSEIGILLNTKESAIWQTICLKHVYSLFKLSVIRRGLNFRPLEKQNFDFIEFL